MVYFHVRNTYTQIEGADSYELWFFNNSLKYATERVEAKKNPYGYSGPDKDSQWDGYVRFLRIPKVKLPWFPSGLLYILEKVCIEKEIPYQINDLREKPEEQLPEFPKICLRDYQQKAVDIAVKRGMGVLDMPPRSGKTRTMLEIVRKLGYPAIWIAPTERIVTQTRDVIAEFFGMNFVYQLVGSSPNKLEEAKHKKVIITTTATAGKLPQEVYDTREMLVIDEFHHAASKTYHRDIFPKCEHIFFRFGMTGTFFRSGSDEMALHAFLSETIYKISAKTLLEKGFLVPTQVVFLPIESPRLTGMGSRTFQGGHGKYGIQEHGPRNQLVSLCALHLANLGKKVLILVGTKKQGRILVSMIRAMLGGDPNANYAPAEFLSTDTPRPRQKKVIQAFLEEDLIQVLIGTSLLGEGVDLPTADALIYARGEQARVSLVQNAYRVSTALPGKEKALIIDFVDRHNKHLLGHSQQRLSTYFAEPTFGVVVLDSARLLSSWLRENFLAQIAP